MSIESRTGPVLRVRGRSFIAMVIAPERPIEPWRASLRAQMARAPGFFDRRPVIIDLTSMPGEGEDLTRFVETLQDEDLRIIGVEGQDSGWSNVNAWGGLPLLGSGRIDRTVLVAEEAPVEPPPSALLRTEPVRSGQSVVFEHGDVTILGFVSSGAEIIAAGSIHVYGALRGRAIAGINGRPDARIFCRKLDPELLAIDGIYKTADDLDPGLRGRAAQCWLEGDQLRAAAL